VKTSNLALTFVLDLDRVMINLALYKFELLGCMSVFVRWISGCFILYESVTCGASNIKNRLCCQMVCWVELSWVELLCISQLVIQFVLVSSPSVAPDQISAEGKTVSGLISWCVFPDGRTSLPRSSSLDPLWRLLYSTLYWSRLCSNFYWSLLHLTFSGISFTGPSTGVFFARTSTGVFFTWPSLESPLLDPLLESSSLIQALLTTFPVIAHFSLGTHIDSTISTKRL
jgi:hypothetical protein